MCSCLSGPEFWGLHNGVQRMKQRNKAPSRFYGKLDRSQVELALRCTRILSDAAFEVWSPASQSGEHASRLVPVFVDLGILTCLTASSKVCHRLLCIRPVYEIPLLKVARLRVDRITALIQSILLETDFPKVGGAPLSWFLPLS